MKDWQTDLTSDGKSLGSVSISEGHPGNFFVVSMLALVLFLTEYKE